MNETIAEWYRWMWLKGKIDTLTLTALGVSLDLISEPTHGRR